MIHIVHVGVPELLGGIISPVFVCNAEKLGVTWG